MRHDAVRFRVFVTLVLHLLSWSPWPTMCISIDYIEIDSSAKYYVGGIFLHSLDTTFSASFYSLSSGQVYLSVSHNTSVVVWTANRDSPASPGDPLIFTPDGIHIGTTPNVVWSTWNSTVGKGAKRVQMKNNGNLVLLDALNKTLWQSFDYPTDTLLTGQALKNNTRLVRRVSDEDISLGLYELSVQSTGDLMLTFYMGSSSDSLAFSYWSMAKDSRLVVGSAVGPADRAMLDSTGLSLISSNVHSPSTVKSSFFWHGTASLCRATLEVDGNVRVYALLSGQWTNVFTFINDVCHLPLYCGHFGLCNGGHCSCPGSLLPLNSTNITYGCQRPPLGPCSNNSSSSSSSSSTSSTLNNSSDSSYFEMVGSGVDYFANEYVSHFKTSGLDSCKELCARNCSTCNALFFYGESRYCYLFSELATIQISNVVNHSLYLRTVASPVQMMSPPLTDPRSSRHELPKFVVPTTALIGACVLIAIVMLVMYQKKALHCFTQKSKEDDNFMGIPGMPTRFTFKVLQDATDNFSRKLGAGAFGSVYEGVLPDKTRVAVKQLEFAQQGWMQFRAEVSTIGSVSHVNLVHLHGFCIEGGHRLLVYEFMANGSLDRHLFRKVAGENDRVLDWTTRYKIALGTARGLAYLHDDCRERIIHCDIKPENILLDESFNAKVSDFGLAKLVKKEEELVLTNLRGTRGYLAPEWLLRSPISEKSDVYSFGMVLLEIVGGRKNYIPADESTSDAKSSYFPAYAFEQCEHGHVEQLVDERLIREAITNTEVERVVWIALWCIQADVSIRPSMGNVVKMLEGSMDVPMPPRSPLRAPTPSYHGAEEVSAHCSHDAFNVDCNNSQPLLSGIHELSIAT